VEEFLDPEFFMENIGQVSVKRGGVGIGAGGEVIKYWSLSGSASKRRSREYRT